MGNDTVKEEETELIRPEVVYKNIVSTKQTYEDITTSALSEIKSAKKNHESEETIANLYGIFYNGIIGMIRSGDLCYRKTGIDGFPEIHVVLGDNVFRVNEMVLYHLIGSNASEIIKPCEDTFSSYVDATNINYSFPSIAVKPSAALVPNVIPQQDPQDKQDKQDKKKFFAVKKKDQADLDDKEIEKIKADYESEIADLKKQIEIIKKDRDEITAKASSSSDVNLTGEIQRKLDQAEKSLLDLEKEKNAIADKYSKATSELSKLNDEIKERDSAISNFEGTRKEAEKLKKEIEEIEADKMKYEYDPNYDHYYSDELPGIVESLEFTHTNGIFRTFAIVGCCIGIVISCLFFI